MLPYHIVSCISTFVSISLSLSLSLSYELSIPQWERQSSLYIIIMNYRQTMKTDLSIPNTNLEYQKVWLFKVALNKSLSLTPCALMRRSNHALEFGVVPSGQSWCFNLGRDFAWSVASICFIGQNFNLISNLATFFHK